MKYLGPSIRDPALVRKLLGEIRETATAPCVLMEVCGGQTHSIVRSGLDRAAARDGHPRARTRVPGVRDAARDDRPRDGRSPRAPT